MLGNVVMFIASPLHVSSLVTTNAGLIFIYNPIIVDSLSKLINHRM